MLPILASLNIGGIMCDFSKFLQVLTFRFKTVFFYRCFSKHKKCPHLPAWAPMIGLTFCTAVLAYERVAWAPMI